MSPFSMQENKSTGKIIFLIVLLLTILPLVLFILVQFAPPREAGTSSEPVQSNTGKTTASGRSAAAEHRAARQEVKTTHTATVPHGMAPDPDDMAPDPDDISVIGVGAVVPNAPRSKQATPYEPGTVPGDSGVMVNYVGSPDDMMSGPQPLPPDDPWGGGVLPPIPPENMRGIGGVRRIDPDDPFFQQDIPNPFDR